MARPTKTGLDYYPMDTKMDDNMEILEAKHGIAGFGVMVKLYQKIYAEGYFVSWDEDNKILFSKRANVEVDFVESVINTAFDREMFSREKYKKYGILTGRGLQKRYFTACKLSKRKEIKAVENYLCINGELKGVITELTSINSEETKVNSELSTQSKVKERKVNKNKTTTTDPVHKKIQHLEILESEHEKLVEQFGQEIVNNVYEGMENYAKLKNYVSGYKTARQWCDRRKKDGWGRSDENGSLRVKSTGKKITVPDSFFFQDPDGD